MKDILQDMSVEEKITLIVTHWFFIGNGTKIAAKVLGYLPNTFELRYSRHQISEANISIMRRRSSIADKELYDSWTKPWWELQGKPKIDQKLRVMGKMAEIEAALRTTEAKELAAGRTSDALVQSMRGVRENVYQKWRDGIHRYAIRSTSPWTDDEDESEDSITETSTAMMVDSQDLAVNTRFSAWFVARS